MISNSNVCSALFVVVSYIHKHFFFIIIIIISFVVGVAAAAVVIVVVICRFSRMCVYSFVRSCVKCFDGRLRVRKLLFSAEQNIAMKQMSSFLMFFNGFTN